MKSSARFTILGTGNLGRAMAIGLAAADRIDPRATILTRRTTHLLDDLAAQGFQTQADNIGAVKQSDIIVVAVEPQQLNALLEEIAPHLEPGRHLLISVVSGASIAAIHEKIGKDVSIVRAMPNMAISLGQSMTCLALSDHDEEVRRTATTVFDALGATLVIAEEQMVAATALCACGVAFFLRAIRAASQGGIEIGFHPEDALQMAAQTALGAASLLLQTGRHPEREIDSVTTPRGCTISGLNEMEHQGFSSALIKGIVVSTEKAAKLYSPTQGA